MGTKLTKTVLSNGLTVHLKEIHSAPLISHWVWYRVGSRDENRGKTGISHWVEHMQFKGTEKFPSSELDKAISGGRGMERVHLFGLDAYYEKLPADKIDLAWSWQETAVNTCTTLRKRIGTHRDYL
jgi:zinc protease